MSAPQPGRTPGIDIMKTETFPPSIIGVETAVPAFVGYTEKAEIGGKPAFLVPVRIDSLADYEATFGKGFSGRYDLVEVTAHNEIDQGKYDVTSYDPQASALEYYRLVPLPSSRFYLYNSLRLFYANGGGTAVVVSAGDYTAAGTKPEGCGPQAEPLLQGLKVAGEQTGPTLSVIPDAVALPGDDGGKAWSSQAFNAVVRGMLAQSAALQDRMAILDVYGTEHAGTQNLTDIIDTFHEAAGDNGLSYGASYFPFLETSVVSAKEISYGNIAAGSQALLKALLTRENARINNSGQIPAEGATGAPAYETVKELIAQMWSGDDDVDQVNASLCDALLLLQEIEKGILNRENVLPAAGAMAGAYTTTDRDRGVWNAPANIALNAVVRPTFAVNDSIQGELTLPVDGKAVNAIRSFIARGTVVWGARTLDANSNDWRYIQVRRTIVYIEQSIRNSLNMFVFAPNDGNTWQTVVSMVSGFLQDLWSRGGLMGATAADAFGVQCGLGSTMTGQDILEGKMIVQVTLQMIRPAEFIELTFVQKMEGA